MSNDTKRHAWSVLVDVLTDIVRVVLLIGLVFSLGHVETWLRVVGGLAVLTLGDIADELRQIRKAVQR